jgi:predicted nucleotidyltransferase
MMRLNKQKFLRTFLNGRGCVGDELSERRRQTKKRFKTLQSKLRSAEKIAKGKACVYATGSFGRVEASLHSDLDLFIVGKADDSGAAKNDDDSALKRLDDIRIKADLIEVTRELGIPEFSGDGRYLIHYSVRQLTKTLGRADDDALNTFTARLLLLLESRTLLESKVYQEIIEEVVAAYWRDFYDHKSDFVPAFLTNDVLRLWRTFCVNYEANTSTEPSEENAKRKLKNYKLKHSRLLTCYSALLYLLSVFRFSKNVGPDDVLKMIALTPTERLEWLLDEKKLKAAHDAVRNVLALYEEFLRKTNYPEKDLVSKFMDQKESRAYLAEAHRLGESVFKAVNLIGDGNKLHRILVV